VVTLLITRNADLNVETNDGFAPLHVAGANVVVVVVVVIRDCEQSNHRR
jgi:hypothetical protein